MATAKKAQAKSPSRKTPAKKPVVKKEVQSNVSVESDKSRLNLNPFSLDKLSKRNKLIILGAILLILIGIIAYINRGLFVAATVNNQPISRLAIVSELENQYGATILSRLIDKALILQEAERKGITATTEEVDARRKEVMDQVSGGNQENFEQILTAQGLTIDEFNEELKIQIAAEKMLGDEVAVSDEELDQFLETNPDLVENAENVEQTRDQIREQLKQQKLQTQYASMMEKLRTDANIVKFIEY